MRKHLHGAMSPSRVAHGDRRRYDGAAPTTCRGHRRTRRACKRARTLDECWPLATMPAPCPAWMPASHSRDDFVWRRTPVIATSPSSSRCPLSNPRAILASTPSSASRRLDPVGWLRNAPAGPEESLPTAVTPGLNQLRLHAIGRGDSEQFPYVLARAAVQAAACRRGHPVAEPTAKTWCSSWKLAGRQPLALVDRAVPDQRVEFDEPFQIAAQAAASPRRSRRMRRPRPALRPASRRRRAAAGSPAAVLVTATSRRSRPRAWRRAARRAAAAAPASTNPARATPAHCGSRRRETRLPRPPWLTTSSRRTAAGARSTSTAQSSRWRPFSWEKRA